VFGRYCNLKPTEALNIIKQTQAAFGSFTTLAKQYQVDTHLTKTIVANIRKYQT